MALMMSGPEPDETAEVTHAWIAASPPVPAETAPAPENCSTRRRVTCVIARLPRFLDPSSGVDLHELVMRPFDRLLGRRTLDRLRVHVDHDVLGFDFGRVTSGQSGITFQPAYARQILERQHHRIDFP